MRGEQEPRPTQVPHKAALVLNWLGDDNVPEVIPAHKQHWLWPRPWRVITGLIIAFSIWGWLDVRNRGQIDPNWRWSHKTDFTVYTEAGAAFFDGREPYEVTNPRGWGYLYPPLFAILVAPLHAIDSRNQVFVWFVISVLMGWGCYREIIRIGRHVLPERKRQGAFGSIPTWFGVAAVTAAMLPALNCLQRGQVGVAKLYLLLLGFRLLLENPVLVRPVLGGIALAAAVTLKITPALPAAIAVGGQCVAAWYARTKSRWQRAGASVAGLCGGLALTLLIVPALFVGWRANLGHLETWWDTVAIRAESTSQEDFAGNSTSVRNQSLANASYRFGNWIHYYFAGGPYDDNGPEQLRLGGQGLLMSAPWAKRAVFAVRFLAGCLALVLAFKMARAQDALGQAASFGMACVATLVVFTIGRGHYYVLLLPAVSFAPLWLLREEHRRAAVTAAVVPCVLVITHYALLKIAGRVGLLGLGTTLWYFSMSAALLRPSRFLAAQNANAPDTPSQNVDERALAA